MLEAPATADLCDKFLGALDDSPPETGVAIQTLLLPLKDFGAVRRFCGKAATVSCSDTNVLVRQYLESPGRGRVLVVDGRGSPRCALLGDNLADLAVRNGWSGIIVNGLIRDSEAISRMSIGVKALGTHPRKSAKRPSDSGSSEVVLSLGEATIRPGDWVYADADGVLVSQQQLML